MSQPWKAAADAVIAERYRLVRELGRGGMGAVWLADHLALDTPCAVKFIDESVAEREDLRSRFRQEAHAAAKLRSPNVVQMFDYGEHEGALFIVMELLEGETLAERLDRKGWLSPSRTVRILRDVARALVKAQNLGIVHRDLKPENVFIVKDADREIAKVLDFGVAKVTQKVEVEGKAHKTHTGMVLGTPFYMSPEQADGTIKLDHRFDQWSLTVMAYECLSGELPFQSEALGNLLGKIMFEDPPSLCEAASELAPSVEPWWRRATSRSPEDRFASATQMIDALERALAGDKAIGETWPDGTRSPSSAPDSSEPNVERAVRSQANAKTLEASATESGANEANQSGLAATTASATLGGFSLPTTGIARSVKLMVAVAVLAAAGLAIWFGRDPAATDGSATAQSSVSTPSTISNAGASTRSAPAASLPAGSSSSAAAALPSSSASAMASATSIAAARSASPRATGLRAAPSSRPANPRSTATTKATAAPATTTKPTAKTVAPPVPVAPPEAGY